MQHTLQSNPSQPRAPRLQPRAPRPQPLCTQAAPRLQPYVARPRLQSARRVHAGPLKQHVGVLRRRQPRGDQAGHLVDICNTPCNTPCNARCNALSNALSNALCIAFCNALCNTGWLPRPPSSLRRRRGAQAPWGREAAAVQPRRGSQAQAQTCEAGDLPGTLTASLGFEPCVAYSRPAWGLLA